MKRSSEEIQELCSARRMLAWTLVMVVVLIGIQCYLLFSFATMPIGMRANQGDHWFPVLYLLTMIPQIAATRRITWAMRSGWEWNLYLICQFIPCLSVMALAGMYLAATWRLQSYHVPIGVFNAISNDFTVSGGKKLTCIRCGEYVEVGTQTCPMCGCEIAAD